MWSIWSDVLYHTVTDDHDDKDIQEYSLEYLGIMVFVKHILKKPTDLSPQESVYNFRAIFFFFDAVVSATPSCIFLPGEIRLKAIKKELERLKMSTMTYYNTYGVNLDNYTGLELCLLETPGPFGLVDVSREARDQMKAACGLMSML